MDVLRTAGFGGLFGVAFAVGTAFQLTCGALGLVTALLSPGLFKMNDAPATGPGQAVGVLLFLLVFGLLINTTISAAGAGIWLGVRRWVLRGKTSGPTRAG